MPLIPHLVSSHRLPNRPNHTTRYAIQNRAPRMRLPVFLTPPTMKPSAGVLAALTVALVTVLSGQTPPDPKRLTQDALLAATKIWTAHIVFTPQAWTDLQPTRNGMAFGVSAGAADW